MADVAFRTARADDVAGIIALLRADALARSRETASPETYLSAFARIAADPSTNVIVGEQDGHILATYHINILHGLSRSATTRAQVEAVRVDSSLRGQGVGKRLMLDAETRARAAGATLIQLTSDRTRDDAHRFYEVLGYTASHLGFKKALAD